MTCPNIAYPPTRTIERAIIVIASVAMTRLSLTRRSARSTASNSSNSSPLLRIVEDLIGADDLLKPVARVRFARILDRDGLPLQHCGRRFEVRLVVGVRPNAKQLVKCPWGAGMFPDGHERITM